MSAQFTAEGCIVRGPAFIDPTPCSVDKVDDGRAISPFDPKEGFKKGFTIEHILLSITVISTKEGAGQFDDSCAHIVAKGLKEYHGVVDVLPEVLYKHTKIEQHADCCGCGLCDPPKPIIEQ
jgi:hypothetical protein